MTQVSMHEELDLGQTLLHTGRHPLAAEVSTALLSRCGLRSGVRTVVGFSGGPDSTALLVLMRALSERQNPPCALPVAVHVDHGLRGESAREAEHAVAFCAALGVHCEVVSLQLERGCGNLAERARDARYEALERVARDHGVDAVCVAHHAEDRLESMLQALCRGSGVGGLTTPRWVRALGDTLLARPLLGISRELLKQLCVDLDLEVLEDPSNTRLDSARGYLRSEVLPALEERWPGAAVRASAAADRLQIAADALEDELERTFGAANQMCWARGCVRDLSAELLAAGFRRAMTDSDQSSEVDLKDRLPSSVLLKVARAVRDQSNQPRSFELAGGWRISVDAHEVRLFCENTTAS